MEVACLFRNAYACVRELTLPDEVWPSKGGPGSARARCELRLSLHAPELNHERPEKKDLLRTRSGITIACSLARQRTGLRSLGAAAMLTICRGPRAPTRGWSARAAHRWQTSQRSAYRGLLGERPQPMIEVSLTLVPQTSLSPTSRKPPFPRNRLRDLAWAD